jgi:hypothetical protein
MTGNKHDSNMLELGVGARSLFQPMDAYIHETKHETAGLREPALSFDARNVLPADTGTTRSSNVEPGPPQQPRAGLVSETVSKLERLASSAPLVPWRLPETRPGNQTVAAFEEEEARALAPYRERLLYKTRNEGLLGGAGRFGARTIDEHAPHSYTQRYAVEAKDSSDAASLSSLQSQLTVNLVKLRRKSAASSAHLLKSVETLQQIRRTSHSAGTSRGGQRTPDYMQLLLQSLLPRIPDAKDMACVCNVFRNAFASYDIVCTCV